MAERGAAAIPMVERLDENNEISHRFVPSRVTRAKHALIFCY